MTNELRNAIRGVTNGIYPEKDFSDSVNALDNFLYLVSIDSKLKENNLLRFISGNSEEQRQQLHEWGNIETILKALLRVSDPEKYSAYEGDKVKLETLYKDIFHLTPLKRPNGGNFSPTHADPKKCPREYPEYPYIEQFVALYQLRNGDITHNTDEISIAVIRQAVSHICVVLLWLSRQHSEKLNKAALYQRFLHELSPSWIKEHDKRHQDKLENIGYVDFRWRANDICTTEQIAFLDSTILENELYIKLLGQAGSGKTTALLHIHHIFLENYEKRAGKKIPVFYELKELPNVDSMLAHIIMSTYNVSEDSARSLLETEQLIFLLDGYNEILNLETRRNFSMQLEKHLASHKKVRVIMTDRSEQNEITVLQNCSKSLRLCVIKDDDRENYFRRNCHDKKVLEKLLTELKQHPEYFEGLKTPMQLYHYMQITDQDGTIPKDFTARYLEHLIERERNEKKDQNLNVLEDYLSTATVLITLENNWVEQAELLAVMAKADRLLGHIGYDTLKALNLATDMGILIKEVRTEGYRKPKNFYKFEDEDYLDYYNDLLYENPVLIGLIDSEETT